METNTTLNIGPGCVFNYQNVNYCITAFDSPETVKARNLKTNLEMVIKISAISESLGDPKDFAGIDLAAVDDEAWKQAIDLYEAIKPLHDNPVRTKADVQAVAEAINIATSSIYRYLDKLNTYGTVTCLLRKTRKDKNTKRLAPEIESIIKDVISTEHLTDKKRSVTSTLREVRRRCKNEGLIQPSKTTILSRIEEIAPEERERKRNGRNAALDFRAQRGSLPGVDRLHSLWQIDHTPVDIQLVDEKDRILVGRPFITVAIDVFSRTVVGWYVSLDPPGSLATGICISRAILPKDELLTKYGVNFPWPCQGKPRIIMADNAKEFRGQMLKGACSEHGFELKFRPVKRPNYGGHIERMLGTLLEDIHSLDGTTFSNSQARGEYDSEKKANMTLDEFETWLANLILGVYHQKIHSAIGCSPLQKYKEGIFGTDDVPGIGMLPVAANPEKLRIDFLPFEERTIQTYGVILDYIEYHDPVLDKWIGSTSQDSKKSKRKFIFRRDPRNISYLIFWDPDAQQYYKIPYRNASRPAISLWELKAIQRYLKAQKKSEIDEEVIFTALNEMKAIEDNSRELTRKARLTKERGKNHRKVTEHLPSAKPAATIKETEPNKPSPAMPKINYADLAPFDEIEPM